MTVLVFGSISFLFFVLTVVTMTCVGVPSRAASHFDSLLTPHHHLRSLIVIMLLTTSIAILTVSLILVAVIMAAWIIARLVLLLHSEGSAGFSAWIAETRTMLFGIGSPNPVRLEDGAEGSDVLVDMKVEGKQL